MMPAWRATACIAALSMLLGGCGLSTLNEIEGLNPSGLTESSSDLARTFDDATIVLPGVNGQPPVRGKLDDNEVRERLAQLASAAPLPTALYMHGCTGLHNVDPLMALAERGVAVIAPNSFARRYRPLQCRPSAKSGGENVFVFDFRLAEVSYALHRMRRLSWVDQSRLVLFGVSEGGVAAALYRGNEFRGRVIAQWTCHGNPLIRGIDAPRDEPVLAIVRSGDPWYDTKHTEGQAGDCGAFMDGRPHSTSVVVDGEPGHHVFDNSQVMVRIVSFVRDSFVR